MENTRWTPRICRSIIWESPKDIYLEIWDSKIVDPKEWEQAQAFSSWIDGRLSCQASKGG